MALNALDWAEVERILSRRGEDCRLSGREVWEAIGVRVKYPTQLLATMSGLDSGDGDCLGED